MARFIRQEKLAEERERLESIGRRIRESFPKEAAAADKVLSSLPAGALIAEIDRSFPEFKQEKLTDLKVFDTLMQLVDPKEIDPKFHLVREYLEKDEREKAEKVCWKVLPHSKQFRLLRTANWRTGKQIFWLLTFLVALLARRSMTTMVPPCLSPIRSSDQASMKLPPRLSGRSRPATIPLMLSRSANPSSLPT